MQEDRDYTVYHSDLSILSAFRMFQTYLKDNGYQGLEYKPEGFPLKLEISPHRRFYAENFEEFMKLLETYPNALPIFVHFRWQKEKYSAFSAIINVKRSGLSVAVLSEDLNIVSIIHDKIKYYFNASNPNEELVKNLSKYELKKSIFLAHRFDEYGDKIAASLNKFLYRLGFDIKEGSGYETKNIPDKVSSKIKAQDIFLCVFTPGDHTWIISEASFAKALDKYIIILFQDNLTINKGIIGGGYEHILFPENYLEKCYSDLLYALPL